MATRLDCITVLLIIPRLPVHESKVTHSKPLEARLGVPPSGSVLLCPDAGSETQHREVVPAPDAVKSQSLLV
jgi:hypothetical protein